MEGTELNNPYDNFKEELNSHPFIFIIGKYDHILGPRAIFSSIQIENEDFIRNLLRDALNTKNKYVILDFDQFYSQVSKINVEDKSARGGKQLYAIILLRHVEYPLIPAIHLKRFEMMFHKINPEKILMDDEGIFKSLFKEIEDIYFKKEHLSPFESINLQIRSAINTIQGFCELILEERQKNGKLSEESLLNYIEMMYDACNDITEALDQPLSTPTK